MGDYLIILILVLAWAGIGYVRGRGMFPRLSNLLAALAWAWCAGFAATALGHTAINEIMIVAFLGTFAWIAPGLGLYFSSYTGVWKEHESEIKFIDKVGLALVPFISPIDIESNRERGLICMALRGGIFSIPLFLGLAVFVSAWALALWPFTLLQGFIYYLNRPFIKYGNSVPEPVTAGLFAILTGVTLLLGS